MVEDQGELYEGEKEGGDVRNEAAQKRPAAAALSPLAEGDSKKSKMDVDEPEEAATSS